MECRRIRSTSLSGWYLGVYEIFPMSVLKKEKMMVLCLYEAPLEGCKTRGTVDSEVSGKVRAILDFKQFATLSTSRLIHIESFPIPDTGSRYSTTNQFYCCLRQLHAKQDPQYILHPKQTPLRRPYAIQKADLMGALWPSDIKRREIIGMPRTSFLTLPY